MSFFSIHGKRREIKELTGKKRTFVPRLEELETRDLLSTFVVNTTSSDPNTSGSLPWAVQQANSTPGSNVIDFNIGTGPQTITLTGTLNISNQVLIDGTSQPGYNGAPLISIQGSANVASLFGLDSGSSGSTIQGLDMFNYTANAVTISNSSSADLIQNNWMGFYINSSNGQVSLNNSLGGQYGDTSGLGIQSSNNTIRGNVIDGSYNAIRMGEDPNATWSGTVYSGNHFIGNFIGTDPSGTTSAGFGNSQSGIFFGAGCQGNYIGPNNVISGNGVHGIEMFAPSDKGNVITGNKLGTDVNGNHAIPNGSDGVTITDGANSNTISNNLISGNAQLGISLGLAGFGTGSYNWVQNNVIGLNASQTGVIGTGQYGVSINNGSVNNQVTGNIICGASLSGVVLASTQSNAVNNNWIGVSTSGAGFGNGHFDVALLPGANFNFVLGNALGPTGVQAIYVDPNAIGNDVQGSSGGGGANNVGAQIQQLFQTYSLLIQDVLSGNFSRVSQDINTIISLYFAIVSEILSSL